MHFPKLCTWKCGAESLKCMCSAGLISNRSRAARSPSAALISLLYETCHWVQRTLRVRANVRKWKCYTSRGESKGARLPSSSLSISGVQNVLHVNVNAFGLVQNAFVSWMQPLPGGPVQIWTQVNRVQSGLKQWLQQSSSCWCGLHLCWVWIFNSIKDGE